jgi:hypothetical protein
MTLMILRIIRPLLLMWLLWLMRILMQRLSVRLLAFTLMVCLRMIFRFRRMFGLTTTCLALMIVLGVAIMLRICLVQLALF